MCDETNYKQNTIRSINLRSPVVVNACRTWSCCTPGWRVTIKGVFLFNFYTFRNLQRHPVVHSISAATHTSVWSKISNHSVSLWYIHTHPDTRSSRPDPTANHRSHLPHLQATAQYPHPRDTEGPITHATRPGARLPRRPHTHVTHCYFSDAHSYHASRD